MKRFLGNPIVHLNNLRGKVAIYKITSPSGRSYIGQTRDFIKRMRSHQQPSSNCTLLRRSVDKYGWGAMDIKVLSLCEIYEADDCERHFIKKHNTFAPEGMNCTTDSRRYTQLRASTKQKISDSMKKSYHSGNMKNKQSKKGRIDFDNLVRGQWSRKK